MGSSPIKTSELAVLLSEYPLKQTANYLLNGFKHGFKINYEGQRNACEYRNLLSVIQNPIEAQKKLNNEISLGRMAGPFCHQPISNIRCSPIGLVPKKTGGLRLITHLSHPPNNSINDFIDTFYTKVTYSPFDNAVSIVKKLGKSALMAKMDIKSAFRLLKCNPGDFDLLGIKLGENYYIDKCMPMGCSISCATFEKFSTFLHWAVTRETNTENLDHYLDDFFFAGEANKNDCKLLMTAFANVCLRLGVPIADEKTVGPCTNIEYLGLTIDSDELLVTIPQDKINKLQDQLTSVLSKRKATLKEMQSLTGSLAFCTRALPSGRTFNRRLYGSFKPHHFIRLTKGIREDLKMWQLFLQEFNGYSYIQDLEWESSSNLHLFTDSAGGKSLGCGAYLDGSWAFLRWPEHWDKTILSDITYLEIIPIALAICIWKTKFQNKKIIFNCDNMAVVSILNNKSSKNLRVMSLLRNIVYWTLMSNFQFKATHIFSIDNKIADALSRGQFQKFREVAKGAEERPQQIPQEFLELLI